MKALTASGERIECDEIEEGRHGVVCHYDGRVVGYVPYDQLTCVTETRTPVASSSLRSVGYDREEEALEVAFHSGGVYRYFDVPEETYRELLHARSQGSYFHDEIRGQYDYQRLR